MAQKQRVYLALYNAPGVVPSTWWGGGENGWSLQNFLWSEKQFSCWCVPGHSAGPPLPACRALRRIHSCSAALSLLDTNLANQQLLCYKNKNSSSTLQGFWIMNVTQIIDIFTPFDRFMTPLMAPYFNPWRDTKTLCTVWHMQRMVRGWSGFWSLWWLHSCSDFSLGTP